MGDFWGIFDSSFELFGVYIGKKMGKNRRIRQGLSSVPGVYIGKKMGKNRTSEIEVFVC